MGFQDFKSIAEVQARYQIIYQEEDFVLPLALEPSLTFREEYEFSLEHLDVLVSEAARCENIIYPVVRDVYKHYADLLALWSHKGITYDSNLAGIPDYIISSRSALGKTVLEKPLLIIVEAKKSDFEQGWGQCLAAMVAAQKMNGQSQLPVYGIVTDGQLWQFGRLVEQQFTLNKASVASSDLAKLFSSLNHLFQQAVAQFEFV